MSYTLVSDATLDLPLDLIEKYGMEIVPMAFNLDGQEIEHYPDERNISTEDFYAALRNGKASVTSQINPAVYTVFLRQYWRRGRISYMWPLLPVSAEPISQPFSRRVC